VFLASTDRQSNLDHHGQVHHAVAEALALAQG
jgi:hypothetical protein